MTMTIITKITMTSLVVQLNQIGLMKMIQLIIYIITRQILSQQQQQQQQQQQ
jgi:hypothetical protein